MKPPGVATQVKAVEKYYLAVPGVLPEKIGGGVRPVSQNTFLIFPTLFMTDQNFETVAVGTVVLNKIYEELFLMVLSILKKN